MGLAAIDHIVRKNTPRFTKSQSLVFIRQVCTEIQRFKNFKIYKEMYGHPDALSDSVRMAIHFFVNFDIFKWLYLSYYWVYLCILFSTLKYNMHIIHMGVTLAELCLLGRNTKHSQVGYIGHRCGRLF